jgi:hypothetical protein
MNTVPLNVEEEQRRSDLAQRLKQDTISLTEAQELRSFGKRKTYDSSTGKLFGIPCSNISNKLCR